MERINLLSKLIDKKSVSQSLYQISFKDFQISNGIIKIDYSVLKNKVSKDNCYLSRDYPNNDKCPNIKHPFDRKDIFPGPCKGGGDINNPNFPNVNPDYDFYCKKNRNNKKNPNSSSSNPRYSESVSSRIAYSESVSSEIGTYSHLPIPNVTSIRIPDHSLPIPEPSIKVVGSEIPFCSLPYESSRDIDGNQKIQMECDNCNGNYSPDFCREYIIKPFEYYPLTVDWIDPITNLTWNGYIEWVSSDLNIMNMKQDGINKKQFYIIGLNEGKFYLEAFIFRNNCPIPTTCIKILIHINKILFDCLKINK